MDPKELLQQLDYNLPKALIAQEPISPRTNARLLVITEDHKFIHTYFYNIKDYLKAGDILVINTTKVIPARLKGETPTHQVDITLAMEIEPGRWQCLIRPSKHITKCNSIKVGNITGEIIERCEHGYIVEFRDDTGSLVSGEELLKLGEMPLPPYIKRAPDKRDKEFYQTVYAKQAGSIAAPTAGLHFTEELLTQLEEKGVIIARILLHVGMGTFLPIKEENILRQSLMSEYYYIEDDVVQLLKEAKGRVVAVGTTTVRTLESWAQSGQTCGTTQLFIMPGYRFKVVDMLITNFHLPKSGPLMLTAAFVGTDILMKSYREAIQLGYRFLSYGDAMLLHRKKKGGNLF